MLEHLFKVHIDHLGFLENATEAAHVLIGLFVGCLLFDAELHELFVYFRD